jgi:hypothetical protein
MSVFAIVLVYATLAKPVHLMIPTPTAAFETLDECISIERGINDKHGFDQPGMTLVYAGCQEVVPFYNDKGAKL